ncbi:MAG: fumarylacetoacetase [Pseudomonadota bacterium]
MPLMRSWVASANDPDCDFPLNNLPYGVVDTDDPRTDYCATAIGDQVLNLAVLESEGLLVPRLRDAPDIQHPGMMTTFWNTFMMMMDWDDYRARLTDLLAENGNPALKDNPELRARALQPIKDVTLGWPFRLAEYTDFYAGRHHATNVGTMFRGPENALPPNWLHIPIGYNGRASSVVLSGADIRRPWGQLKGPNDDVPRLAPSARFDLELEMGAIVGTFSEGPVTVDEADSMIFGYVLLNDWSARDIQAWEYQPLGPFQAKATATSISPWIVTKAALEPFRVETPQREKPLLPHLQDTGPMLYDIDLSVTLAPEGKPATTIARTNYGEMYYSSAQQLAHHSTSGCPMSVGDLLGSGTISGPEKHQRGSLLELSWGGKEPIRLDTGETRSFLEDGDTLTLRGHAQGDGYRIGFGECSGTILPALDDPYEQ